jgi:hypothetical protein
MVKTNRQINKEDSVSDNTPDSPAVIAYRLGQVEVAVKEGFDKHDAKLTELTSNFASVSTVNALSIRIGSLESDRKWLVRLVIGSVVFAMLALIGVGFKLNQ